MHKFIEIRSFFKETKPSLGTVLNIKSTFINVELCTDISIRPTSDKRLPFCIELSSTNSGENFSSFYYPNEQFALQVLDYITYNRVLIPTDLLQAFHHYLEVNNGPKTEDDKGNKKEATS